MRHPEGGYILQEIVGLERITDFYGRESLVLHFKSEWPATEPVEPIAILLNNYGAPKKPYTDAQDWLLEALENGDDGEWGKVPKEPVAA